MTILSALAVALLLAAAMTLLFQRLHLPVVLGYLVAGMIAGPHVPVPLVADPVAVGTLSELGVALLMFSLGLELGVRELARVGPAAGLAAVVQCSVMLWLGFVTARLLGWSPLESAFCGAAVAISSTTIIAKAFDEQNVRGRLRTLVVGILVIEDLVGILLLALLQAVGASRQVSAGALVLTFARLVGFLAAFVGVGLVAIPPLVRAVIRRGRTELVVISTIALCFGGALLAHELGYSTALGAFLAGALVAESGHARWIDRLIHPVRDLFAAIFFVSVGMMIDPAIVPREWPAIVALTGVVVVGKIGSVALGAFLAGSGVRTAVAAGMSMAQIGEMSFIIVALGQSLDAVHAGLYPVVVATSAVTTLLTPWLIRASGPAASLVDRKLPRRLQIFAALYGSWLQRIKTRDVGAPVRRLVRLLLVDTAWLAALAIGAALAPLPVRIALAVVAIPFLAGSFRVGRKLGAVLAHAALPMPPPGKLDLAVAPRRALTVALQLACVLLAGTPLVAVTQPFLGGASGALALLGLVTVLALVLWRSATQLQGHVRAGAQIVAERLLSRTSPPLPEPLEREIGEPEPFELARGSAAVGRSLADLDLRGATGATVLVIVRRGAPIAPTAHEPLERGDLILLAGTREAIAAARARLGA